MICCILHNLCIMENDVFGDDLGDEGCNDNNASICQERCSKKRPFFTHSCLNFGCINVTVFVDMNIVHMRVNTTSIDANDP